MVGSQATYNKLPRNKHETVPTQMVANEGTGPVTVKTKSTIPQAKSNRRIRASRGVVAAGRSPRDYRFGI